MKKLLLLLGLLLIISYQNHAQIIASSNDTSNFPYWVQMMQDPDANFFQTQKAFETYWKDRQVVRSHGWRVFKRWEYMTRSRVLPNGDRRAPDADLKAYETYVSSHDNSLTAGGANWISLGPSTIPAPGPAGYEGLGRINTVAWHPTDPNKIYIGAPAGGLWQSTDGGATWVTHTDSLATLGVSAILIDPSNPSVILMGTGDRDAGDAPGLGVYKSTDAGLTWTPSNSGMGNKTISKMIQNGATVLAASNGGVYRSLNSGSSWNLSTSGNFKDIVFKPGDFNTVYASSGGTFYRSTNNGTSFTQISSGLPGGQQRIAIAVTAANPNYVYLLISGNDSGLKGVYRSTDSGLTFTLMFDSYNILDWSCDGSGEGGQGWYDLALAADPTSANTIYVGGVDVWKSTDGGLTFNINSHWYGGCGVPSVHADCHFLGFSPYGKLWACNDGGVWETADGGTTWNDHTEGITIGEIYKLGQSQTVKDHVINGLQDNGTYSYTPTGWEATGGGDGMECLIDYQQDGYTYHTIYYGDIYRKYNNASEVHIAGNGVGAINESGDWVTPFILHNSDPKTMFVGFKNIWRTTNCRQGVPLWKKISDNLGGTNSENMRALENCQSNPNILYISRNDGAFFRTDNCLSENPTWTGLTGNVPGSGTINSIETNPLNENIVYITRGTSVYKSTDKGVTWTNITGTLPSVTKNYIVCYRNDNEGLYVATDAGVYFRNSSMTDWVNFSAGLPVNARINELEIYYDNDSVSADVIRAASYGRALWGSNLRQAAPEVDFTASPLTVSAFCPVSFTDLTANAPTHWQWTFTGATPSVSSDKNPTGISWATPGDYAVKLKAWNDAGSDSLTKTAFIHVTVASAPVADFSADYIAVCEGDKVHFTDLSGNCPASWLWEFNPTNVTFTDGTSATSQNPVVYLNSIGTYSVRLTATNGIGSNSVTKASYLSNGGFMVPFFEDFEGGFGRNGWTMVNSDGNLTWDTIMVPGTTPGPNTAAWMNLFSYGNMANRDQLVSPPMNFTNLTGATLYFQHSYAQRGSLKDSLIVKVSSDCGATWERVLKLGAGATPDLLATHADTIVSFFPASANDWCNGSYGLDCYVVDLTPWAGNHDIKVLFETYNRHGNNLFLDNIMISGPVGVPGGISRHRDFSIYPNPSTGMFNLVVNNDSRSNVIEVFSPNGQLVFHENVVLTKGAVHQINLSGLSKGIYYLRLTSDKESSTEKIIIY